MFWLPVRGVRFLGLFPLLMMLALPPGDLARVRAQPPEANLLVYHQITERPSTTGSVGLPVLSADGSTAVFTDAPGAGDPANPNRIFTIAADGTNQTEVDAYQSNCFCSSEVTISADGGTVLSTESMQVRLAQNGAARTIADFTSNEVSSIRLSADGSRAFFILARDTAPVGASEVLQRGIYTVNTDGSELRQIVGPDQIAPLLGVTADTISMQRLYVQGLGVSADGAQLVFGALAPTGAAVFSVSSDGSNLTLHREGLEFAFRVAISGDGARIVYDVLPADPGGDVGEIIVDSFQGGTPQTLLTGLSGSFADPIQLNPDGSLLLVSPNGLLVDTASGDAQLLAAPVSNTGGNHTAVITEGLPRATMDETAHRFLYVMRTTRCADCANESEQLAILDRDPVDLGEAPEISDANIDPDSIALNYESSATAQATVTTEGTVIGVGFTALLGAVIDANVGWGVLLHDDGQQGDVTAGDGVYTATGIVHGPVVVRDDDTGPRTIRIAAEIEGADGRRHATAIDIGTLMVGESSTERQATPTG